MHYTAAGCFTLPHAYATGFGISARAAKLSKARKSEIAKVAARARWGAPPLKATHRGNFKEEFEIDVDCYVLDDEQKTPSSVSAGWVPRLGSARQWQAATGLRPRRQSRSLPWS